MTRHQDDPTIDWSAVQESEEFQELVTRRGRFVRIAAVSILTWRYLRLPTTVFAGLEARVLRLAVPELQS